MFFAPAGTLYVSCHASFSRVVCAQLRSWYPNKLMRCHESDDLVMFALDVAFPAPMVVRVLSALPEVEPFSWKWFPWNKEQPYCYEA